MFVLTLEEIKQYGITGNELSEIVFHNKTFIKGSTYSQRCRNSAITYGEEYAATQGECILIDSGAYLTMWLERKSNASSDNKKSLESSSPISQTPAQSNANNNSSIREDTQSNPDRALRKYRGSYY